MNDIRDILLATRNPGKAREMREILGRSPSETAPALPLQWRQLAEFPHWPSPIEDGTDFPANAAIKAHHYARLSGLWTLADDSGLEVDALGGEPGVRSARYAGEPPSDDANNTRLIQRLAHVPPDQRTARFRCAVVLSDGHRILASAHGTVQGRIIDPPRGTNGFGYDPHFWYPPDAMTVAQMTPQRKHAISHRGQALRRLHAQLANLLPSPP